MPRLLRHLLLLSLAVAILAGFPTGAVAQDAPIAAQTPSDDWRRSQPARVVQRMGSTEMTVVYNRPTARGRELFGALMPWDSIWNPGADEATRIEIDRDVLLDGQLLRAGRYSIWAVPRRDEWTLVFSRAWDVQHRPYPAGQDALTLRIRPRPAAHMESLAFYFPMVDAESATLVLHWGETMIPISIRRP
jgi:hypothetical protein